MLWILYTLYNSILEYFRNFLKYKLGYELTSGGNVTRKMFIELHPIETNYELEVTTPAVKENVLSLRKIINFYHIPRNYLLKTQV